MPSAPAANAGDYKDLLSTLQAEIDRLSKGKIDTVGGELMGNSSKKFKAFGFTQCGSNRRPGESSAQK